MTLITSQPREAPAMTDRIAKEDITEVNELGQTVVLVAAGQPIPEGVDVSAKQVEAPAENKARKAPARSKRKS